MRKTYKPNYIISFILYGIIVLFFIVSTIISFGFDLKMISAYILIFIFLISLELFLFTQTVELDEEVMRIWSGGGYLFGGRPSQINYRDIKNLKEIIIPISVKFSYLKVSTDKKDYIILLKGIRNYEGMRDALLKRLPPQVKIDLRLKE
ncbi:MAG: hypothetical protein B6D56_06690 [Candidatus Omnitrophica bacterium 4484_70.1]|nr:MAG: hypothetical protein B6D56_06690 [Candidatus Omnitrophica bacterium 4484_70.1]